MSYRDFDLKKVQRELGVVLIEKPHLFLNANNVEISPFLLETLQENVPLARAINTEKARTAILIQQIYLKPTVYHLFLVLLYFKKRINDT